MKFLKFAFLVVILTQISCSKSDSESNSENIIDFRIDHYKTTAVGLDLQLVFRVQKGDDIGSDSWGRSFEGVRGFDYEPGFVFDLKVEEVELSDPPEDGASIIYNLVEVVSKTAVSESTEFSIPIIWNRHTVFLTGNETDGYMILDEIDIDCADLCSDLSDVRNMDALVFAKFKRISNSEYKLLDLVIED